VLGRETLNMADQSSQADIRGLDLTKLVRGFAEEALVMKKYVTVSPTSAREIRWFQKTAGFLDSEDTTDITASQIPTSEKSLPVIAGPSFTRQTSYVKFFKVESELISRADVQDTDLDLIATTIRDLTRAVGRQVDLHIYNVITENDTPANIQTIAITDEWDDTANCIPISDLAKAREYIKNYAYEPNGAVFCCRPDVERFLLNYLIAVKGSSIPQFASAKVGDAVLLEIMGFKVVSTTVVTSDKAVIFVPQTACIYKELMPISAVQIEEKLIGTKIRVAEEGVALLTDPKAVVFFSNIGPS